MRRAVCRHCAAGDDGFRREQAGVHLQPGVLMAHTTTDASLTPPARHHFLCCTRARAPGFALPYRAADERIACWCRHGCRPSAECTAHGSSSIGYAVAAAADPPMASIQLAYPMADGWRKRTHHLLVAPNQRTAGSTQANLPRRTRARPRVYPSPVGADPLAAAAASASGWLATDMNTKTIGSTTLRSLSLPILDGRTLTLVTQTTASRLSTTMKTPQHSG